MLARLLLASALVLAAPASAQTAPAAPRAAPAPAPAPARVPLALQMLAGSWALRVEDTIMFRFDLVRSGDGWTGVWV
jgi:hypothetical protein